MLQKTETLLWFLVIKTFKERLLHLIIERVLRPHPYWAWEKKIKIPYRNGPPSVLTHMDGSLVDTPRSTPEKLPTI